MVVGPYLLDAPHFDGVLGVTINGQHRCHAVFVTTRLALSIASCFLVPTPFNDTQQHECLRAGCESSIVPVTSVRLVAAPDARLKSVDARVTRISVRFTAAWAIPICTRELCGEGWDIALLELNPSCDHGPLACLPPMSVATVRASIGMTPTAVGYGANPEYNKRGEYDLVLHANGSGVRRAAPARIWKVESKQRLAAERISTASEGPLDARIGPFCVGDYGAALVSQRGDVWELDGLSVPSSDPKDHWVGAGAEGCAQPNADAWSVYSARCWIEYEARKWGHSPLVPAHAAECGDLDFYPPELSYHYLGGGGATSGEILASRGVAADGDQASDVAAALAGGGGVGGNCSTVSCELGVCVEGRCVCEIGVYGPRCTLRGPPPSTYTAYDSIIVAPHGADDEMCGSARAPCATLRHALARQYWQSHGGFASGLRWELTGGVGPPSVGVEITNARLANALITRTVFTQAEVTKFELGEVSASAYIAAAGAHYRPMGGGLASITLMDGTYEGASNRELILHGTDVVIRGLRGPETTLVDCASEIDGSFNLLFLRGEHAGVQVSGLTLRKCLVDEQIQTALAAVPKYFAAVAGSARWPAGRQGATFRGVRWLSA